VVGDEGGHARLVDHGGHGVDFRPDRRVGQQAGERRRIPRPGHAGAGDAAVHPFGAADKGANPFRLFHPDTGSRFRDLRHSALPIHFSPDAQLPVAPPEAWICANNNHKLGCGLWFGEEQGKRKRLNNHSPHPELVEG
jgi:hypothetical protein